MFEKSHRAPKAQSEGSPQASFSAASGLVASMIRALKGRKNLRASSMRYKLTLRIPDVSRAGYLLIAAHAAFKKFSNNF